jgi:integrase
MSDRALEDVKEVVLAVITIGATDELTTTRCAKRRRPARVSCRSRRCLRCIYASLTEKTGRVGLVFGRGPDEPFAPVTVNRRAQRAWKRAGLRPIGLPECRHTFASFMIAAGVNAKALSVYMGHASVAITFDLYGHLMPGQ